ncbi:hypothetical protein HL663_03820 [Arthrobacter sp. NEB 688]|nr:hypothetical protein HL663_03820 [Arthrobacter sp. NEB 688]
MTDRLLELVRDLPPVAVHLVVVLVVGGESALLVGTVLPSLSVVLAAGALAAAGVLHVGVLLPSLVLAVVVGDQLGLATGRVLGPRLRTSRLGRRVGPAVWDRAEGVLAAHGALAVLVARFVPVARTLVPHLAGAAGVSRARVAAASAVAGSLWAGAEVAAGYVAGRAAGGWRPQLPWWVVALVVVGVVVVAAVLLGTSRRSGTPTPSGGAGRARGAQATDHPGDEHVDRGRGQRARGRCEATGGDRAHGAEHRRVAQVQLVPAQMGQRRREPVDEVGEVTLDRLLDRESHRRTGAAGPGRDAGRSMDAPDQQTDSGRSPTEACGDPSLRTARARPRPGSGRGRPRSGGLHPFRERV